MKEIKDIDDEIDKGSTGIFKDRDGDICYLLNGEWHREDGPAIERSNGDHSWYFHGKLHRSDGPAEEWSNRSKYWYLHGKLHRSDGPAIEWSDGTIRYFYYGIKAINKKQFYDPSWRKKIEMKVFL